MSRQIDLQRCHGHPSVGQGMKIGTRPRARFRPCGANPKYSAAPGVRRRHHGFGPVTVSESRRFKALQFIIWHIGYVDIENRIVGQWIISQAVDYLPCDPTRGVEMTTISGGE